MVAALNTYASPKFDENIELEDNAMLKVRPELFQEWDFEKNDELCLDVYKVTKGSHKRAWWICKDGHNWDAIISSRSKGIGCPYCSGRYATAENNLINHFSYNDDEWNYEKNCKISPKNICSGSTRKVWWKCIKCKSDYDMRVSHKVNGIGCPYCGGRRVNHTNSLASLNPELSKEWHLTKNGDLTSHDVTCGSNKKVWWLGDCGHEWDAKVSERNNGHGCPYCSKYKSRVLKGFNDMWTTNPELANLLADHEDGYKYTQYSNNKVNWRCPDCNNLLKSKSINNIAYRGISCENCSDGISYPEKFMYHLLKHLNIEFQYDVMFDWSAKKRFDFYLREHNAIIEVHGSQHYKPSFERVGGRTLASEIENDRFKKKLALNNNIINYIEIDCRESNPEYIKNNILKSELIKLLDIKEIEWDSIGLKASNSLILEVADIWNSGERYIYNISNALKLNNTTIKTYLEKAKFANLCDYDESKLKYLNRINEPIIQLDDELNFVNRWNSASDIIAELGVSKSSVYRCLNGTIDFHNGFKWMKESDYISLIKKIDKG